MNTITSPDGTLASRFVFGTMQWGGDADEAAARQMFEDCRAAGITHFDTAWGYTGGESERILGRLAAPERDRLVIATKIGTQNRCDPATLRAQFEECRQRLDMDTVDILYLHTFDPDTALQATLDTVAEFHAAGQARHIGLSNYAAWQVMKARALAPGLPIDVIQPMYNLVKRQAEVEILPMAAAERLMCCPYSPLGGGLLTGKYARGETGRIENTGFYAERYKPRWMHAAAADFAALARDEGLNPATLAVAWVAAHPARPCPIISARRPEQLQPSLDAIGFEVAPDLYARLCALTPTPPPATDRLEEA